MQANIRRKLKKLSKSLYLKITYKNSQIFSKIIQLFTKIFVIKLIEMTKKDFEDLSSHKKKLIFIKCRFL